MKPISALVLIAFTALILFFSFRTAQDDSKTIPQSEERSRQAPRLTQHTERPSNTSGRPGRDAPIPVQVQYILDHPNNASAYDTNLMRLLKEDEDAVLAHLNSVVYTEGESDQVFNEIQLVSKTLDYYFIERSFNDVIETLEKIKDCPYLHDGALQQIISNSVARHEGRDTPQYAQVYDWVKNNPEVQAAQDAGTTIGGMLALSDPENGWKKANALPSGRIRSEALTAVLTQTYVDDISKAAEPLSQIEIGPDLDPAITNLVQYGLDQGEHHDVLAEWATQISDHTLRRMSLEQAITSWLKDDPAALEEWIASIPANDQKLAAEAKLLHKQAQVNHVVD